MIIFCSTNGLIILSESKRWHADGTFSSVPSLFYQLYIIHGFYKSNMIPSAFILLTGKSEALYRKMLKELKEGGLNNSMDLQPNELTIDFELAVMNAFKYHFPRITIGFFQRLFFSFRSKFV